MGFSLFEEFPLRFRPVFKALVLSSGMLTTLGAMIGRNILLDSQGLPYLAEYCYVLIHLKGLAVNICIKP